MSKTWKRKNRRWDDEDFVTEKDLRERKKKAKKKRQDSRMEDSAEDDHWSSLNTMRNLNTGFGYGKKW